MPDDPLYVEAEEHLPVRAAVDRSAGAPDGAERGGATSGLVAGEGSSRGGDGQGPDRRPFEHREQYGRPAPSEGEHRRLGDGGHMQRHDPPSTATMLGRGVLAGVVGTVAMTAFQKLVEMPLTGRSDSYAPANLAEKLLPVHPSRPAQRRSLNNTVHFALGGMWGTAYALAAVRGLRGQRAVNTVFAVVYSGDVLLNTALGLYSPSRWTTEDWAVDVVDKYLQAQATGAVFDRALDPRRTS